MIHIRAIVNRFVAASVIIGLLASHAHADTNEIPVELRRMDQSFAFFKTTGKYPTVTKYYPAICQLHSILCGTHDQELHTYRPVKTAEDLTNLRVLRSVILYADPTVYAMTDKKFDGYRESFVGQGLEKLFLAVGLLPEVKFKGTPLADEIREGLPLRWVTTYEDFKATREYLTKEFSGENGNPTNKILLALEIVDSPEKLTAEDQDFLQQYFIILDPTDEATIAFFTEAEQKLRDIAGADMPIKHVQESWGEMFMRHLEKDTNDFKGKEISTKGSSMLIAALTGGLFAEVLKETMKDLAYNPLKNKIVQTYRTVTGRP